jgi:hypothetical protein
MISRIKSTVLAAFVVLGCREAASPSSCDPSITAADSPVLEVKFTENLRIRGCSRATLHSERGATLLGLQTALDRAKIVKIQPMFDAASVAILEADARRLSPGEPVADLLSWHLIGLAPGADTTAVLTLLRARPEVAVAYVHSEVNPPPP